MYDLEEWLAQWLYNALDLRFSRSWDHLPEEVRQEWLVTAHQLLSDLEKEMK